MTWSWQKTCVPSLVIAVMVVVAVQVAATLDQADNERGEGPLLAAIARMWREPVSADWLKGPEYTLTCYGPLYLWTTMGVQAVADGRDSLLPGRLVSLAATLGTAALLAWAIRKQTRRTSLALIAALCYLLVRPVHYWGHLHRVDAMAVFFSIAGIIAAGPSCRRPWLSALLIVAGSLVKPTAAFSAIPVAVCFLLKKKYRLAIGYSLSVALLGICAWSAVAAVMDHDFFIAAIRANMNGMSLMRGIDNSLYYIGSATAIATLGVLGHLTVRNRRQSARAARSLYVVAWIASALICTLLATKEGSGSYYFMEPTALAALVICRYGPRELRRPPKSRWKTAAAIVLAACTLPPTLVLLCREAGRAYDRPRAGPLLLEPQNGQKRISVLADGECVAAALQSGCTVAVNDPYLFRLLVDNGGVDPGPLLRAMERGDVEYLLLRAPPDSYGAADKADQQWPASVLESMRRHYEFDRQAPGMLIFRARSARPVAEENRSSTKPPLLRK